MAHRKGKRRHFQKAADTQQQLESIEKEQAGFRKGARGERIRSVEKSKQRFDNANRRLKTMKDFEEEYD